uniref:Uncharacterized protein n=1 Tax=Cannabis sativa TaxID=3483 RepID=A0A803QA88_CANSA
MAIGGMVVSNVGRNYEGSGLNAFVVVTCLVAAMGGLIFGYDLGISVSPTLSIRNGTSKDERSSQHRIPNGYNHCPSSDEFQDLVDACEASKKIQNPWKNILLPQYRPQLTICILVPFFQQLTGINVIMFYAPVLFKTLGFGDNASLISSAITGVVNVLATIVSIVSVDRFGRRVLFLEGGTQMIICQIAVAVLIALNFGVSGEGVLTKPEADLLLVLICAYVAAFAWSWGPLGWLVPRGLTTKSTTTDHSD